MLWIEPGPPLWGCLLSLESCVSIQVVAKVATRAKAILIIAQAAGCVAGDSKF